MAETPLRFSELLIEEEMKGSYLTYAMSTLMDRALPDVRDGLKPSQRRILVAMNDLNLGPRAKHRKCAKVVGDTNGNYHPHGDQSIYPTLVRMGQEWSLRYMLIHKQGNFGSIDGDPPAAMRYTEARLAAPASELLEDLNLGTVDFRPNFDETTDEPLVLPGKFPNLLVNGSIGIAVGMATSMAPHNLREVCAGIQAYLDNPEITLFELMQHIPGPDFPTGGVVCGQRGVLTAYETGRARVTLRGRVRVEDVRGGRKMIVIDEIPYGVIRRTVVEKIADGIKDGVISDASTVTDTSDRKNPIRIEVDVRRDGNPDVAINQIYKHSPMQVTFSIMNNALVDGRPVALTLKQLVEEYVQHRRNVIRRRTEFLRRRATQRAHILEGLLLAISDIDRIIQLIRTSNDPADAKVRLLSESFRLIESEALRNLLPEAFYESGTTSDHRLTGPQTDAILSMQLQRLTNLEIERVGGEYSKLVDEIARYDAILADERLVNDIIRNDIQEMSDKYGDDRRTELAPAVDDFSDEDLIPDEQVVVTMTHTGYVKRLPIDGYRTQGRGGRGVRGSEIAENDWLQDLFVASTHDYLLCFTTHGRIYWLRVYRIPEMARTARGRSIANMLTFQEGETLTAVLPVKEFQEDFLMFATRKGIVKKTPLTAFRRPLSRGIWAIALNGDDSLVEVAQTTGNDEIVLGTTNGQAIRFSEQDVRAMGRQARGVRGVRLGAGDEVVGMVIARPGESILTVCQNGFGKRTELDEYRLQSRGGRGIINIRVSERNGKVVAIKSVTDDDHLMMMTRNGILIRTDLSEIRAIGRATQGVRLIRLDDNDELVAVTQLAVEEDAEGNGESNGA
jgi:DNA gyrase subunit A